MLQHIKEVVFLHILVHWPQITNYKFIFLAFWICFGPPFYNFIYMALKITKLQNTYKKQLNNNIKKHKQIETTDFSNENPLLEA